MIQPNELRIGNYVGSESNSIFDGRIRGLINALEVVSIDSKGINAWQDHGASGNVKFEELFGLPLTEEWLLKFGFTKKTSKEYWQRYCIEDENGIEVLYLLATDMNSFDAFDAIDRNPICDYTQRYVHQLQNLYFVLTGKELELNAVHNNSTERSSTN